MRGRGKYVYCVIRATEPLRFGAIGLGGVPVEVHTIHYKDVAAVVGDTVLDVHEPTRRNVLAHESVTELVMAKHTVIPMSFGTVFKTHEDIVELLRAAYDAFDDVLTKMHDKVEFGLKVLWDRELLISELAKEDEDIRRLKDEIANPNGSTYFARMQYGRLVDSALQARSAEIARRVHERLRPLAAASRHNEPIGDRMIVNLAFLVARPEWHAFDAAVKELAREFDVLRFTYTGPWPPYNFVNVRLKLE
jgi:hypothetical protein